MLKNNSIRNVNRIIKASFCLAKRQLVAEIEPAHGVGDEAGRANAEKTATEHLQRSEMTRCTNGRRHAAAATFCFLFGWDKVTPSTERRTAMSLSTTPSGGV
jgi:hypothetical protein